MVIERGRRREKARSRGKKIGRKEWGRTKEEYRKKGERKEGEGGERGKERANCENRKNVKKVKAWKTIKTKREMTN